MRFHVAHAWIALAAVYAITYAVVNIMHYLNTTVAQTAVHLAR